MRHSDRAVQMPTSASGNRLCRHGIVGGCTRFCSYKLFAKVIAITIVVLALICGGVWLTGGDSHDRVRDVLYGVGAYLALVVPGIVIANSRERRE
jgi:tellurite resistance protein TehA-like permease